MKKFFLLASLTLVLASCGNDEKSVEQVIESEDLEAIRAKKKPN